MTFAPPTDNEAIRQTRDLLAILSQEIKKSNKASAKLSKSMLILTWVMAVVAIIEFFGIVLSWIKF